MVGAEVGGAMATGAPKDNVVCAKLVVVGAGAVGLGASVLKPPNRESSDGTEGCSAGFCC